MRSNIIMAAMFLTIVLLTTINITLNFKINQRLIEQSQALLIIDTDTTAILDVLDIWQLDVE